MKFIDDFLNKITMYRLVLYYLIVLLSVSVVFSFFHILPYNPVYIILSSLFLFFFSGFINDIFGRVFEIPTNVESAYITALILALIITPATSVKDYIFLGWAAILSMATKYILAIHKKHIFNPVAIAVVLTAFGINETARWWVGNVPLLPFVLIGGYLIVRKIRREKLVMSFFVAATLSVLLFSFVKGSDIVSVFNKFFLHSSLFFFAFVMLTEPLTSPPTEMLQIYFGAIVGFLFVPDIHLGTIFSTPELALIIGNIFSFLVSPPYKLKLFLKEKIQLSPDSYDFVFPLEKKLAFIPGQYMEWTLPVKNPDDRGNRRYFTIASSPTEDIIRIGVKFYAPSSSYKKEMLALTEKTPVLVTQLAGDFTLPQDKTKKLVFLAGGIGITPFRSILKYLIDTKEKRDIVLFYSNKTPSEIVYADVCNEAWKQLNIRTIYTVTDIASAPPDWKQEKGRVNADMLKKYVPDYLERTYYLSGPHAMVTGFESVLSSLAIPKSQIKTDFFPGFV